MTAMSLADEIIYGDINRLYSLISRGVKLDEIDEYGYTPLIETTIINSIEKAKLLIDAGADVDFTDLTGRTPLHWAADNNNLEMCSLLLSHKANPNAYTIAGEPILVMPLLRKQKKLWKLFYEYQADRIFALDFINTKLLGHRYELDGHVDIVDHNGTFVEIEFAGFYLEFTISIILNSLKHFNEQVVAINLTHFFDKLAVILKSFEIAGELIQYQHFNVDVKHYENRIDSLLDYPVLLIPVTYEGHAISFIRYGNLLVRCDRGIYGKEHGTVIIYEMGRPEALTKAFIKDLLYKPLSRNFIQDDLEYILGLRPLMQLPLEPQVVGNCSWANIEATIPAIIFLLSLRDHPKAISKCKKMALDFYDQWINWDRYHALLYCVEDFKISSKQRQAAKAALLAAILFQRCDYENNKDLQKERKILPILSDINFNYILRNYIDVFCQNKKYIRGANLVNMLDDFGIDKEHMRED